jgi:hypothetical protein
MDINDATTLQSEEHIIRSTRVRKRRESKAM